MQKMCHKYIWTANYTKAYIFVWFGWFIYKFQGIICSLILPILAFSKLKDLPSPNIQAYDSSTN